MFLSILDPYLLFRLQLLVDSLQTLELPETHGRGACIVFLGSSSPSASTPHDGATSPNYPFSSVISSARLQNSSSPPCPLGIHEMKVEDCGAKASTCAMLRILCEESGDFSPTASPSYVDGIHQNHVASPPQIFQAAR